ncbi:ABC transporter ATP-binding protein [Ohtaekwangia koreensis]|uniref:Lipopolysaccharide transport system ATP-binding protein n=1 Tax=Ohtaekwangia koreensis TaxID=688867 RepID=A0A1T5KR14_9BACT|nr:ABC transporter ATP-binding protein [Ohtaekwangia koreensis]SKC65869.1 lipopolysaccharide transport system ATP-binding protein [Ohtaekwangia koreensis]
MTSDTIIQVENLSKLYRLGKIGTGSLRQDVQRWWYQSILRKEDPFFKAAGNKGESTEFLWALRDINFDIKEGEAFAIIGRNGAGKSTLLKILSKVIRPTQGHVLGRGRMNSLLEIGTGFHEELTGRENIYLNGHFLGMKHQEIKSKFDEIVEFSGVSQFIDTPVKRYSSGMYVRLAFAVAAHLEPDILVVDEVLAVGDAEFQKKCLGKMNEASKKEGRTILFVSHNMQAVTNLCHRAMLLQKGKTLQIGTSDKVVNYYLSGIQQNQLSQEWNDPKAAPGNDIVRVKSVRLVPDLDDPATPIDVRTRLSLEFEFWNYDDGIDLVTGIHLFTQSSECIFDVSSKSKNYSKGLIKGTCTIPGNFLNDGSYYISIIFVKGTSVEVFYLNECISFDVEDYRENTNWYGKWMGYVRPDFPVVLTPIPSF